MNRLRQILAFLGSRTLTVWLVASFILYYLTMAVWFGEAFARYISHLASSTLFRLCYVLFAVNCTMLLVRSIRKTGWTNMGTLLRLPLFTGFILFLLTFFMSVNMREFRWLFLGRGDTVSLPWEKGGTYRVDHVEPALKKNILRGPDSAIFDFEPGIVLLDGAGGKHSVGAYPPRAVGSSFMHVLNFGIGPGVELKRQGVTIYQGYVGLRLIPFSSEDTFTIDPFPYTFSLKIIPNKVIKRGRESVDNYDLEQPAYRVTVTQGDREIAHGETSTSLSFDDGMSINFHPPDDWVMVEAAYDPFIPWLALSIGLCIIGMVLYPCSFLVRRSPDSAAPSLL